MTTSRYNTKGLGYDDKQMQGYEAINDNVHRYAYMLIGISINKNIRML